MFTVSCGIHCSMDSLELLETEAYFYISIFICHFMSHCISDYLLVYVCKALV